MTRFKGKKIEPLHEDDSLIEEALNSESKEINSENEFDLDNKGIETDSTEAANASQMITELEEKLRKKEQECEEYLDLLKRSKAEFDNYRKRTLKEKDSIYVDGFSDGIKQILPVIDNLERAVVYADAAAGEGLLKGVEMVLKMFSDTLTKNEVEELPSVGSKFDPELHDAVMHVVDESFGENEVIEVLQKGYKYKEKIVRHSMVKVAN